MAVPNSLIVHIPLASGPACGARLDSFSGETKKFLCLKCMHVLEIQLREAIRDHLATGNRVMDPEGLIDRFLGERMQL